MVLAEYLHDAPSPLAVLHIAPERQVKTQLDRDQGDVRYVSLDITDQADVQADIVEGIPFPGDSFDLVVCSHVLEHVSDDRAAMREMRRVTRGTAIVLVPFPGIPTTDEDPTADEQERIERFWQANHLRLYGWDLVDRLEEAGFSVKSLTAHEVAGAHEARRMRLRLDERLFVCRAR